MTITRPAPTGNLARPRCPARLGTFGLGAWGQALDRAHAGGPSVALQGCHSREKARRAPFVERLGRRPHPSHQELPADPAVDGVIATFPNHRSAGDRPRFRRPPGGCSPAGERSYRPVRAASQSEWLSNAWSTMTVATTSPGTDGWPRLEGNTSSTRTSGKSSPRWSAKNASRLTRGTTWQHRAAASRSSRLESDRPCTRQPSKMPEQLASTRRPSVHQAPSPTCPSPP